MVRHMWLPTTRLYLSLVTTLYLEQQSLANGCCCEFTAN
jgi:hypothetical protein